MKMLLWVLGSLIAVLIIGGAALQFAISRNGPAVLSAVDRITGGSQDAELKATISTGQHEQQKLIVWGPAQRDPATAPLPVLMFTHGGSWRSGDPVDYGFIGRAFVANGFIVVLVGYRLGEDGKYPAMLEDTARAVAWTHEEIAAYGGDPEKIVLAGHSAGAYNSVMMSLEEQWLGRRGLPIDTIKGVIGLAGPYDFLPLDSDSTKASFGHVEPLAMTQPVNHVRPDAPPMLLIHGEDDTLVGPYHSANLAKLIEDVGGSVIHSRMVGMDHNTPLIHHAAPWRDNGEMISVTAGFAHAVTASVSESSETSVPVQEETR